MSCRRLMFALLPCLLLAAICGAHPHETVCTRHYELDASESCRSVAEAHGMTTGDVAALNDGLDCENLDGIERLCLERRPVSRSRQRRGGDVIVQVQLTVDKDGHVKQVQIVEKSSGGSKTNATLKLFHHYDHKETTYPAVDFSWKGADRCHPIDHCKFTNQERGWGSAVIWLPNEKWCMCFNEHSDCTGRTVCFRGPKSEPTNFGRDFGTENYVIRSVSVYDHMCNTGNAHVSNHRPTVPYRDQC